MSARSCSESRSRRGWSGSSREPSGMNCSRSGSSLGVRPVDQRQQVRRHAHRHRRALEAALRVGDESSETSPSSVGEQLADVRDRVLGLPLVVEELGLADVRVGGDAPPELAAQQLAVASVAGSTAGFSAGGGVDGETWPACYPMPMGADRLLQRTTWSTTTAARSRTQCRQRPASAVGARAKPNRSGLVDEPEHRDFVAGRSSAPRHQVSPRRDHVDVPRPGRRRAGSRALPRSSSGPSSASSHARTRHNGAVAAWPGSAAQVPRRCSGPSPEPIPPKAANERRQRGQHPQAPARDAGGRACGRRPRESQPVSQSWPATSQRRISRARRAQARAATPAGADARPARGPAPTRNESLGDVLGQPTESLQPGARNDLPPR